MKLEGDTFRLNANDGTEVFVSPTIYYYIKENKVKDLFLRHRKELSDIEKTYLRDVAYSSFRNVISRYNIDELFSQRSTCDTLLRESIRSEVEQDGIVITQVLYDYRFPRGVEKSIMIKNIMHQLVLSKKDWYNTNNTSSSRYYNCGCE